METGLTPRQRTELRRARENGYLDARAAGAANLLMAFSLWCWRLKLPVVWLERNSPRSRYGRVRLDLYTTSNRLSVEGQAQMQGIVPGAVDISPHDALWSHVPLANLGPLAARVLKTALRPGNCEAAAPRWIPAERRRPAKLIELPRAQTASA